MLALIHKAGDLGSISDSLSLVVTMILSALVWYLVIHFFFPRKN